MIPLKVMQSGGYQTVRVYNSFGGKCFKIHRLMWQSFNNCEIPKGYVIDHIDRNKLNNCLSNLRMITHGENGWNTDRRGCSMNESGTWSAGITTLGKHHSLGTYQTYDEAHAAYLEAKKSYHSTIDEAKRLNKLADEKEILRKAEERKLRAKLKHYSIPFSSSS